jgi:mandelate racemase
MKITSLQVRCLSVPLAEPHRTASGTVAASPLVLLDLGTDAGVHGHAMLFSYMPAAHRPLGDLVQNLEPLLVGQPLAPVTVSDGLAARFRLLGAQGLAGMALAGIDMALWDAFARAQQLPLHALLGAQARPIPAYAGIGYDGADGSARAAEAWARQGFRAMKAKIGYPTLDEDLAVVRAMRAAVGPGIELMVDYNQSLEPAEAARRLRVLDGEGLAWIEEPVLAHDYAALVRLAGAVRTPLLAGENWWGPLDFRHALDAGVSGMAMPDAMKCGGVTGWQRIAAAARLHGIGIASHLWPELSAQLLCATPTARWLEHVEWWNPVLREPLDVREGQAYPSTQPGSGIDFDPRALERYSV